MNHDSDDLETRVIAIVQDTLRQHGDSDLVLSAADSMDTIAEWDSMQFMSIFLTVNEEFQLDPDFDDAIHYTAIESLVSYLRRQSV